MSKARIQVSFGQTPAPSAQMNNLIRDYIVPAKLIFSFQMVWSDAWSLAFHADPAYLAWYPYNPLKNVYDQLRIHGGLLDSSLAGVSSLTREYSLDSGASWIPWPSGTATGLPLSATTGTVASHTYFDIDLREILEFQHIGIRVDYEGNWLTAVHEEYNFFGFLWSTADDPF